MSRTAKVSISLPENVLDAAERERRSTGESRSEFFRRAVEALLKQKREDEAVEQYMAGYLAEPETPYEVDAIDGASHETLSGEPWS